MRLNFALTRSVYLLLTYREPLNHPSGHLESGSENLFTMLEGIQDSRLVMGMQGSKHSLLQMVVKVEEMVLKVVLRVEHKVKVLVELGQKQVQLFFKFPQ